MSVIITRADARHVMWVFGVDASEDALVPSEFTEALIRLIKQADEPNRKRLAKVYPGLVAAVGMIRDPDDGLARLRILAGRE